ncbi:phage tail protein, partial [Salmonella enterica subsp. enterica serovar Anatum]|nr:phage tail protein [Salmonella enterica subsp. enterica serovar Anatum]
ERGKLRAVNAERNDGCARFCRHKTCSVINFHQRAGHGNPPFRGKFPESYKPLLPGGCGKQVCIRLIMEVSNTTAVTLTVDPSIV